MNLFLSPHYDDAIYSCGGTISSLTAAGEPVTVLTICAGMPPSDTLSPFAQQLHQRWGAADAAAVQAMVTLRRTEDEAALGIVAADGAYFDVPDCIYRQDKAGQRWLYADEQALFGTLHRGEEELIAEIGRKLADYVAQLAHRSDVNVFAPLAIGNHVDHQLVRRAAEYGLGAETLTYYQDYPYVLNREQIVPYERAADWKAHIIKLDDTAIMQKVAAVAAYASQISTFWQDRLELEREVRRFVRDCEDGERVWHFRPGGR